MTTSQAQIQLALYKVLQVADPRKLRITIEGHQGSGKTTLAEFLALALPGVEIRERQTQPLPPLRDDA